MDRKLIVSILVYKVCYVELTDTCKNSGYTKQTNIDRVDFMMHIIWEQHDKKYLKNTVHLTSWQTELGIVRRKDNKILTDSGPNTSTSAWVATDESAINKQKHVDASR